MRLRKIAHLFGAVCIGLMATIVVSPHSNAVAAQKPQQFVSVGGSGAWSIFGPLVSWQNDLASALSYVNLNYTAHGTVIGREALINKTVDFAISGVPFTDAELKQAGGNGAFISAPLQVASAAVYVEPTAVFGQPEFEVWRHLRSRDGSGLCDPDDESTWPVDAAVTDPCYSKERFSTGDVRIPNANLGAMLLNARVGSPRLNTWNHPDVLRAFGLNPDAGDFINVAVPQVVGPATAGRSDADEMNFYVGQYIKAVAPTAWSAQNGNAGLSERSIPTSATRDGAEQQLQLLANGGHGVGVGGGGEGAPSGGLAAVPPALRNAFKNAYQIPGTVACCQPLMTTEVQNAHGDWVGPTPAATSKAAEAGGETPLYALDHDVEGAYPITWIDRIYMPAHGLSVEKTEGLAMMLRYLVTTGQNREAAALEGRLPQSLVSKALAAADALVQSNCKGNDRKIVETSDPGPLAPPTATEMRSIGSMLHCEPVAAPTTTTTVASGGTGFSNFGGGGGGGFGSLNPGGTDTGSGTNAASPGTNSPGTSPGDVASDVPSDGSDPANPDLKATKKSALLVVDTLPIPAPTGASSTDRLAAFLLGVALYLLLRKPVGRLIHRLSS